VWRASGAYLAASSLARKYQRDPGERATALPPKAHSAKLWVTSSVWRRRDGKPGRAKNEMNRLTRDHELD
jgi:hypothetical protein